jgi:serine/threonine protein phosphatase PrpC
VNKIENNNLKELNSINNNDMSKEKKNTSIVNNKRKVLGNSNNHSTSNFNIKNNKRINIIMNEDLKKYFFKGKSTPKENTNQKKNNKIFIISNKNKLKSKPKTQKDNSKNTIPKPITSKIDLKLAKIPEDNNLYNEDLLKYIERRANTSLTNYKEKNDENKIVENNYIDNALINIRGVSIPGKDTQNQIKLNTDSYIIKRDINNIKNFNIFGIFDGHGFYGHTISVYVKENLFRKIVDHPAIQNLKNLNDIYNQFKKNNFKIIKDIFNEIDYQLLYQKNDFDIKLSGSTCNIIIQIGDHIICANTGDSRAIIVYENKTNNYQALSLSYDCKPDLPKEKERILKKGGIITALKDSFQEAKGSLRVFMKGNSLPGLPMSRSFGDKLGKDIGIIVDPLINEYILNKDVKYIIMASDGIWEFLNNEQVMTIGNKYYMNNDPDTFCQILIKKSTELWEKNSRNIDDITLIVIYFTFL